MSGGVRPTGDIRLAKKEHRDPKQRTNRSRGGRGGIFFTFSQLNALAVIVILSASSLVGLLDISFVIFSFIYLYFLSRFAFPPSPSPESQSPVFSGDNKLFRLYVLVGALIGLFLPIAYIFEGIYEGDKEGIKAAAPHVFLLASQIFMEGVVSIGGFSIPIRVCVPVLFNSMRIFAILEWLRVEIVSEGDKRGGGYRGSGRRLWVGRWLAVANMAFWSFNLFGFLLPVYFPKAFKKYYTSMDKVED